MTIKELEEHVTTLTEQMGLLVSGINQLLQDRQIQQETNQMIVSALQKLSNDTTTAGPQPNQHVPHVDPNPGTDKKMGNSKTKKRRNNKKVSKSRKDPQHTEKNKAASASASPSVSQVNENYDDSRDLETAAAFKVSIADTYTHPKLIGPRVSDSGYFLRSWTEKGIIPGRTKCRYGHDLEAMAALGVSAVFTHPFPKYEGPPLKNSADNPESWAALGNPYIH